MGHSQGTLIMFTKLASDPNFADRVNRFFALAPVANVKNIKGLLKYLAEYIYPYFPNIFDFFGDKEFLPNNWIMKLISEFVCNNLIGELICDNVIFLLAGPEIDNMNKTRTAVYTSHAPAGTSTENIIHWTQM
jgi:lysosomal acid lipase/cholesteryl ester hydrolase